MKFPEGLAEQVLDRDKVCFMKRIDPAHQCMTRFRRRHASDDRRFLTMEHVKRRLALGIPKVHKLEQLVALCGFENNRPPTAATRALMRSYLAALYPDHWRS